MLAFFALAVATTIYTNLDLAVLDLMKGDAEAGLYGVSIRIKLVIVSIITSVSAVLLPRNSYYYEQGKKDEFLRLLSVTMNVVVTIAAAATMYFILFADDCILLLAGHGFAGSGASMKIIMPTVVLIGISNIIGIQMLVPQGREKETVKASVIGATVDLALNLILIPRFASAGAAAATLAAEACVTGYMVYSVRGSVSELFRRISLPGIAAGLLVAYAVSLPARAVNGVFMRLLLSALCFFGAYCAIIFIIWRKNGLLHSN
jgi:O-antigen/teichoic acid export membrane protein